MKIRPMTYALLFLLLAFSFSACVQVDHSRIDATPGSGKGGGSQMQQNRGGQD